MPPPDDKQYPLATKTAAPRVSRSAGRSVGHSISARDYSLPKPYRRKRFVEDKPDMSRSRVAMLAFSGVLIASLVVALALLAKENLHSPPVMVIAAPKEPAQDTAGKSAASAQTRKVAGPIAGKAAPRRAREPMASHGRDLTKVSAPLPASLPPAKKVAKISQVPSLTEPAVPDADVVLITAILTLTPRPEPDTTGACTPSMGGDHGCAAIHGMKP